MKAFVVFTIGSIAGILMVYALGMLEASVFLVPLIFALLSFLSFFFGKPPQSRSSEKKVCLIIPAHNEEDSVERSIRSAMSQTYENMVIALVNDGSTDKTGEIMKKYADGKRVIYVENYPNIGKFQSILKVRKTIEADIYVIVDADNEFPPNYVEHYVKRMKDIDMLESTISVYFTTKTFTAFMHAAETILINWIRLTNVVQAFTGMGAFLKKEVLDFLINSGITGRDDGVMLNAAKKFGNFRSRFFFGPSLKGVATHRFEDFIRQRDRWYTVGLKEDARNEVGWVVFSYGLFAGVVLSIAVLGLLMRNTYLAILIESILAVAVIGGVGCHIFDIKKCFTVGIAGVSDLIVNSAILIMSIFRIATGRVPEKWFKVKRS